MEKEDTEIFKEALALHFGQLKTSNPEQFKAAVNNFEMREICVKHRGKYIEFIAMMESAIDDIIVEHFCGGDAVKKDELMHVILVTDKITLMSKWLIVKFIYEAYFPEVNKWFNATNDTGKTMYNTVIDIIKDRNKIAHRIYSPTIEEELGFDGKTINLSKKEESKGKIVNKPLLLNEDIMKELGETMAVLFIKLIEIQKAIIKKRTD